MRSLARSWKQEAKTIAFVPTMGSLHEGHAALLRKGRELADILVLSIFVNPIQFGENEDLNRYPRVLEQDCRVASACGVDCVFTPTAMEMYPEGFQTSVSVRELSKPLCGANRPGHFDGVATVVTKLFNIVAPDMAIFGRKDYQQLTLIKRMADDLSLPVAIIDIPIVRELDGIAMSSRNSYLSPQERQSALAISRAIAEVRALYDSGERSIETLTQKAFDVIQQEPILKIDYLEFRDARTLQLSDRAKDDVLFALAVKAGTTRLIDNTVLGEKE